MEQRIQQEGADAEIQPAPREVNLGAGSFRVSDQNEAEMEEKKQLLRRKLAGKVGSFAIILHTEGQNTHSVNHLTHPCGVYIELCKHC